MRELFYIARWFRRFYRITNGQWIVILTVFLLLWTGLLIVLSPAGREYSDSENHGQRDRWKSVFLQILNLLLVLAGLVAIDFVTLVRWSDSSHHMVLIPLRPLFGLNVPKSYWHVTVMNIVLFVPFACGLSCCLGIRSMLRADREPRRIPIRHPVAFTILVCFLLSVLAETAQYFFGMGLCEVDDVLMNTLGGAVGTIPFCLMCVLMKHGRM